MICAASLSIFSLRSLRRTFPSSNARFACTLVSRSSHFITGIVVVRSNSSINASVRSVCSLRVPSRRTGTPTTIFPTWRSAQTLTISRLTTASPPPSMYVSGDATVPVSSLSASPTRLFPKSTPRTRIQSQKSFVFFLRRQFLHHVAHFLRLVAVADQRRIIGVHDHEVLHTNRRHQMFLAAQDNAIARIDLHKFTARDVAAGVLLVVPPDRRPVADIVPIEIAVGDDHVPRLLHDRVINRDLFHLGIFTRQHMRKRLRPGGLLDPPAGVPEHRLKLAKSFRDRAIRPDEHPRIPTIIAAGHKLLRCLAVRLLHKAPGLPEFRRRFVGKLLAELDVAIPRVRPARLDSDGNENILCRRQFQRIADNSPIIFHVGNVRVRRQDRHHRVGVLLTNHRRRYSNGRRGIASQRFGNEMLHARKLFAHQWRLLLVRHHHNPRIAHQRTHPFDRLLDHRLVADNRQQLLRLLAPTLRPEPFPIPTRHDDCPIHFTSPLSSPPVPSHRRIAPPWPPIADWIHETPSGSQGRF